MANVFLQVEGLTKSYGDRLLFGDVTFGVNEGDKIGIVARNGDGKSTLLKILAGKEDYDSGRIAYRNGIRVGYLEQQPDIPADMSAVEYVVSRSEEIATHLTDAAGEARRLLTQFGIADTDTPMGHLSGGQAKRVALAAVILSNPDFLLLDEPTNHLDLSTIEWLENYLTRQRVTLLMVTHDRYFLDNVCSRIVEIDRQQLYTYDGNFDYYLRRCAERIEAIEADAARARNLLRTETEWMRRQPQARGSKSKTRIDNYYQLEQRSRVRTDRADVELNTRATYIGKKIFEANHISKSYGNKVILSDWSYTFARYEKVGIVGENGVGKSTLIKMLLGEVAPDSGNFDVGQTVRWGYYSQEGMDCLDESKRVIDAVREIAEDVRIDEKTRISASSFLTRFLFTPDTQQKYISKLSGGERRRLYLATVLMRNPNFLVLDEPTNDLDIMTLGVLENYLTEFEGCVIVVSHDRFFLDNIVDHLFVLEGDGTVKDFPGNYTQYRAYARQKEKENNLELKKEKENPGNSSGSPRGWRKQNEKRKLTFKEKQEMEQLPVRIEALEKERGEIEERLSGGTLNHTEIAAEAARLEEIKTELDAAELRYLELLDI